MGIEEILVDNLPWIWAIAGILLIASEALLPGVYLLWFGLAAVVVSGIVWLSGMDWLVSVVVFCLLSVVTIYIGRYMMLKSYSPDSGQKRLKRYVDRRAVLIEAIHSGVGRIRLDDTTWLVRGPDLPKGREVEIVGSEGPYLIVKSVT